MDDEDGERRVRAKRSGDKVEEVDQLRNLPDCLLNEILLKLPTKDVIKWRYVPGLDFECRDFMTSEFHDPSEFITMLGFVYRYLGFNSEPCLQKFKLTVNLYEGVFLDTAHFTHWMNAVFERKVQHLHILDRFWGMDGVVIPRTVYSCESLVSLTLCDVYLLNPPELVSLPSLKVIVLDAVLFDNDFDFEVLISGCPVLESLTVNNGNLENLEVCSQSLLTFTYVVDEGFTTAVVVDAPRLEYLRLSGQRTESFLIENHGSLVKADIDTAFGLFYGNGFDPEDLPKRHMIRDFLVGISCVKDMIISSTTLEIIYDYSKYEKLPLFRNISFLRVVFTDDRWEMLPIFLESCTNLKSLVLEFCTRPEEEGVGILPGPRRFLTSLEYVKIVKPDSEEEEEAT